MSYARVISSDSHVNVRHEDVKARLASTFHDDYDAALVEYARTVFGGNAAKANQAGAEIQHASWGRPGHFEPRARLADMDTDGVDVEVLYCEVSAYRYLYLLRTGSHEATRAFNDTLHDFASADPSRLVVTYQVPIHDIDVAIQEVQRIASMGGKSLQLPVFPAELGQPDYFDERYDPLFAAIAETGLPICCHIGLNTALDQLAARDPTPRLALTLSCTPPTACEALGIWLLTGILVRFPELKLVFVEPGLGWVAWYLTFLDDMVLRQGYEFPVLQGELPSFYYHRNMSMTFIDEPDSVRHLRHVLGTENLMWSSDYPHPVSTWPKSLAVIDEQLGDLPQRDRDLMVWENATPRLEPVTRTIPRLVRGAVDEVPDSTWLCAGDDELTFADAQARIERAAAGLRAAGVDRGDRVVVVARNSADCLLLWLALMEVGAIQVPVNPAATRTELDGLLRQVEPSLVLDAAATVAALFAAAPDGRGPAAVDEHDVAVMIPTSGTTGRSKLVMQTHRAYVMAGEGFPWWMRLDADDRLMTSLPLFHINAPAYSVLGSIAARAGLVLLPSFSASTFLESARRHGATEFNAIGAMLEILMRQPERDDDADTPLRLCYTGPSPPRARHEEIERRFGLEVVCGYAMSETPYGLIWPHGTRPFGTLGSPRQHPVLGHVNDARVVDAEVGDRSVGPGMVGELELRNPCIMRGYYGMPDETAAVMHDGWLRTGDLVVDGGDGTYTFVGRKKEVIRRRGENLSPAEVEAVLEQHPTVAEAAVVAVPSELTEDDVKAFVVAAPGAVVEPAALRDFAAQHLAAFKVPRYVEVVDDLPHTPTGRIAKHRLPTERTVDEVDGGAR